ncbi:tetratricopeptide repeat protein [Rhodopila sp.]|uniref:tetratricopeptide repeat protein n=1 Tax=Rhodopila sp. TaxID=2480087 RepID=UPI003D0A46BD
MDSSLVCSMPDQTIALDQAIQDHQAGRLAVAEATYRRILDHDPNQSDALHLLGLLACDRGDAQTARQLTDAAIRQDPTRAAFHNTRARALIALGLFTEAETAYRTGWSLRPDTPEIANNLGCLLRDRGDIDGAVEWLGRANRLAGTSAEIACNLADALAAKGASDASLIMFRQAMTLSPHSADIRYKFGQLLVALGQLGEAANSYRAAIRLRPEHAASHNNLGLVLQEQGDPDAATRCFQHALHHNQHCADAHYNLGCLLLLNGRTDEARDCYERAIKADALHGGALWARCMVELPILYEATEQISLQRARYAERLMALVDRADDPAVARVLAATIGDSQPFFLPYQGACDRDLQTSYGTLVARLLRTETPSLAASPAPGEPIRIGIVSGFFREHTIWRLMLKGWLSQLDPDGFNVHAYHTSSAEDEQTDVARRLCARFTGGRGINIRAAIRADQPHVLLYPELGMDRVAIRLAGERLAPVQCVAWGQPETSGLPTMDFFLSSALMESDAAAAHYSERLVTLPNLGIHYTPDDHVAEACSRAELGLRQDAVIFWCGQALYKYLPQYDDVLARIAAAVGDCQFLFIGFAKSRAVTERFGLRLRKAFAGRGLNSDRYCVFLDPMSQARFLGTVRLADIVLDSIGWSGGKSTLDALAEAPVIVTHAGTLMRGRHTTAILTGIGVTETIATTLDDYVEIAVRLARDPSERTSLRARMAAGRHRIIADTAPIRALETFLIQAVRQNPTA